MAIEFNSDYLNWDAETIKRVIIQNLAGDPKFTDQIFENSNLTTLIDIFAYTFDSLSYYINHGASEAIFTDSQLYENLNRIVKMLGYNPNGYSSPATESIFITTGQSADDPVDERLVKDINGSDVPITQAILPKYTFVSTGLADTIGNSVFYSMTANRFITPDVDGILPENNTTDKTDFINGRWKLYETTFTAAGIPNEEFTLDLIDLEDIDNPRFIAHPYIDVYVRSPNSINQINDLGTFTLYQPVAQGTLFNVDNSIVGPSDKVFQLRINENKQYSITFGDGVHAPRLTPGDEIFIVFLEGNGSSGEIGNDFFTTNNELDYGIIGMEDELFEAIIGIPEDSLLTKDQLSKLYLKNLTASTSFASLETVDQIRDNAPNFFRTGERLITATDFENWVKDTFRNDVYDSKAMNNYEYLAKFLAWLDSYNLLTIDIREREYIYADSCDSNNIYIWNKYKVAEISPGIVERSMTTRKVLTAEPIILSTLDRVFVPAVKNNNYDTTGATGWDPCIENWIEVERDKNSIVSAERIKQDVIEIIRNFFDPEITSIGATVDLRQLQQNIEGIEGVSRVRTAFLSKADQEKNRCDKTEYFNGLSFATWTSKVISGADLKIFAGNEKVEDFQFPELLDEAQLKLEARVKIVFDALGNPSIEY
jgi:hypothetical protein